MRVKIKLTIDCEENTCGACIYKQIHKTGLVGEFHPFCELFYGHYGKWGELDMKRSQKCKNAQKLANRSNFKKFCNKAE